MKKPVLFIGLLLLVVGIQAQNLKGVWFAGCNLKIDKYAGVDEFKIDSLYGIEGSILDFTSKNEFLIKSIGEESRIGNYSRRGDTLHLSLEDFKWQAIVKDEELKLKLIDSSDYELELFYKKLSPSKISTSKLLDSTNVINSNWKTSFDWGYSLFSLNAKDSIDVIGKPKVFISSFSKIRTATEVGNYQIDTYKNHIFLYLLGRETLVEKVIHFSDYVNGEYVGEIFDCFHPLKKPVPVQDVLMIQEPELMENELVNEMANVLGRYQLRLLNVQELGLSDSVKTVISYFKLKEDFSCEIEAYVTEDVEGVAVLRKLEKNGTWELDPSSHFISVKFEDGHECLLTISKEEREFNLFLNRNPWPEEEELNTVLKFTKQ